MTVSALDIIKPALRKTGEIEGNETPSSDQIAVALDCLNGIIDTWSATSGTAVNNEEIVVTLPANQRTITIGEGQAIDVPRPYRIESAYARIYNIDRPIQIVDKAQYDSIILKQLGTNWPEVIWYDGGVPTGNLYVWPQASYSVELHVTVLRYVRSFTDANDSQALPQGHKRALILALANEVAPEFGLQPSSALQQQAALAYRSIVRANYQVPDLDTSNNRVESRLGQFLSGGL